MSENLRNPVDREVPPQVQDYMLPGAKPFTQVVGVVMMVLIFLVLFIVAGGFIGMAMQGS